MTTTYSRNASYVYLTSDEWDEKIRSLFTIAETCSLCPRNCGVNRSSGKRGFCDAPDSMVISSIFPHHGEEPPISGTNGSGTVFFSYCTLKCCFCQNYQISQEYEGSVYSPEKLAEEMLVLQKKKCHNINLVTPTHFLPWIVQALKIAAGKGLTIPIVYNSSGYETETVISVLNGIVDIYLPDMKYGSSESALRYSRAPDYPEYNQKAIRAMFRQVGVLKNDSDSIAWRGLCIRHLVLPDNRSDSTGILRFLTASFDPQDIFISLMSQYRPLYKACNFPEINRMTADEEYNIVKDSFIQAGFQGFFQEIEEKDREFIIDFKKRKNEALTGDTPSIKDRDE